MPHPERTPLAAALYDLRQTTLSLEVCASSLTAESVLHDHPKWSSDHTVRIVQMVETIQMMHTELLDMTARPKAGQGRPLIDVLADYKDDE